MGVAFANAKATHIFVSKKFSVYAIFNDHSFNDTLTNDIVSFEKLGPDFFFVLEDNKLYDIPTISCLLGSQNGI